MPYTKEVLAEDSRRLWAQPCPRWIQGDRLGYEYKIAFHMEELGKLAQFLERLPANNERATRLS